MNGRLSETIGRMCVPLTIFYHVYFLGMSKVLNILHYGSMGRVYSNECYFIFAYTFLAFLLLFLSKKTCIFIIFVSFSMNYQISGAEY